MLLIGGVGASFWFSRPQSTINHTLITSNYCEMCHRPEAELYRGDVKIRLVGIRPSWKGPVTCNDCHDYILHQSMSQRCVECHSAPYLVFLTEWTTGFDEEMKLIANKLQRVESALAGAAPGNVLGIRAKRLLKETREILDFVKKGRAVHNPNVARALLTVARQKSEQALDAVARQ